MLIQPLSVNLTLGKWRMWGIYRALHPDPGKRGASPSGPCNPSGEASLFSRSLSRQCRLIDLPIMQFCNVIWLAGRQEQPVLKIAHWVMWGILPSGRSPLPKSKSVVKIAHRLMYYPRPLPQRQVSNDDALYFATVRCNYIDHSMMYSPRKASLFSKSPKG